MVRDAIKETLDAVEDKLHRVVQSDVTVLNDASHHIIESGGKRMRPRLVFLSYLAAGGVDPAVIVPLAAAIELVHTATLVHDDINDHSLTRRGKIAVHARWGRTFALLTGDYLFAKVYEMMAPYGDRINTIMADATVELVEGETLQAAAAKSGQMDRETYKKIIALKTASLFRAAGEMGAILADADDDVVEAVRDYGYYLGLAFQIVDDILDIVGDPEKLGKPIGADLNQGTGAIAVHNGRRSAHSDVSVAEAEKDPFQQMLIRLRESGAVEVARSEAEEMAERARDALERIPDSPARQELNYLIDAVLERER
ncbi:MAG TPA: polyprenyl synthetase family protein [Candidatus Sulfomarinibacteraceae bacterium]|nr:polyprenyl synthetase family protein [Candidatus Sulfomarinibacteraceae bacterium]